VPGPLTLVILCCCAQSVPRSRKDAAVTLGHAPFMSCAEVTVKHAVRPQPVALNGSTIATTMRRSSAPRDRDCLSKFIVKLAVA
jgi:hypothetical protein